MAPPEAFEETMLPRETPLGQRSGALEDTSERCNTVRFTAQVEEVDTDREVWDGPYFPIRVDPSKFRKYLSCPEFDELTLSGVHKGKFLTAEQDGLSSTKLKIPDQNDGDMSASYGDVVGEDEQKCSVTAETPAIEDVTNAMSAFPSSVSQHSTMGVYSKVNSLELQCETVRREETAVCSILDFLNHFYTTKCLTHKLFHSVSAEENNVELPFCTIKDHLWEYLDFRGDKPADTTNISHETSGSKLKSLPQKERTGCLLSLPVKPSESPKGSPYRDKEATEDTVMSAESDGPVYSQCSFQEASPGSALDSTPSSSPCLAPGHTQDHSQSRIVAAPQNKTQLGGETKQKESPKYEKVDERERNKPAQKKHRPTWTDGSPVDADSSSSPKHSSSQSADAKQTQSSQQNNNGRKGSSGARRWRGRVDRFGGGGGDDGEENAPPNDRKTDHSINPTAEEEMKKKPAPGMHGAFSVDYPHPPVPPEAELRETDDQPKSLYNFKPPPKSSSDLESTSMSSYSGESNDSSSSALATANNFESEPLRRAPVQNDTGFQSTPTGLLGVVDLPDDADDTLECQVEQPLVNARQQEQDQPRDADAIADSLVFNEHSPANVTQQLDEHPPGEDNGDGRASPPPTHDPEAVAVAVAEPKYHVLDSFEYLDNNKPLMVSSPISITSQYGEGSPLLQVPPDVIAAGHSGEAHFNGFCGCLVKVCDDTLPNRSELVVTSNLSPLQRPRVVPPVAQEDEMLHDENPLVLLRPDTIETHTTAEEYYVWSFSALVDAFVAEANDFLNNDNDDY